VWRSEELERLFRVFSSVVRLTSSGAIRIPLALREYADLRREVTILGRDEWLEVWSRAAKRTESRARPVERDR
jgi:DNA-binding transcriptional regulator/RsmH inhibitor MraZ